MTALTDMRVRVIKRFRDLNIPLAAGYAAYRGGRVGNIPLTYTCAPMGSVANQTALGSVIGRDITVAGDLVSIELDETIEVEYMANDTNAGAIAIATDFMKIAQYKDDHTFTISANNGAGLTYQKAGFIVDVDPVSGDVGVWVDPMISRTATASLVS